MIATLSPRSRIVKRTWHGTTRYDTKKFMKEDPLNYTGKHVSGTTMGIINHMTYISENYYRLETPYIFFQGGNDKLVDPCACIDLERESVSKDKTTVIYRDMWHEIPYEPEYEEICDLTAKWLKSRVAVKEL